MKDPEPKFLVVDDDHETCYAVWRILKKLGLECASASTIDGAKTILETEHVDVVICDWFFSGFQGGLELRGWIEEKGVDVRFYIATGMSSSHSGFREEFIQKPITTKIIEEILNGESMPTTYAIDSNGN